jgi:hypothetical protein
VSRPPSDISVPDARILQRIIADAARSELRRTNGYGAVVRWRLEDTVRAVFGMERTDVNHALETLELRGYIDLYPCEIVVTPAGIATVATDAEREMVADLQETRPGRLVIPAPSVADALEAALGWR